MADEVILLPIYPARELPVAGVTSQLISSKMKKAEVKVLEKQDFLKWMDDVYVPAAGKDYGSLFITAGAGDIDTLLGDIKAKLEHIF